MMKKETRDQSELKTLEKALQKEAKAKINLGFTDYTDVGHRESDHQKQTQVKMIFVFAVYYTVK